MGFQILISFGKRAAAKKAVVGGERRRIGGFNDQMFGRINEGAFSLGVVAPKNEDQVFFFFGQPMDDSVGKKFPAFVLVRTGLMGADGQGGVKQEDALFGTVLETAGSRGCFTKIGVDFLINVNQRWRQRDAIGNRERKAVGLTGAVVGVLAENNDFDLGDRDAIESVENKSGGWIDSAVLVLTFNKFSQILEVRFVKLIFEEFLPGFFKSDVHGGFFILSC